MVTTDDFICIVPQTEEVLLAIEYAGRSIHYTYDRMRYGARPNKDRLIRIAVGIVIEKTFERWLRSSGIDFSISGRTHWRQPDLCEFTIGKRRIDIKGYHVYPGAQRYIPNWFLEVEGLVPVSHLFRQSNVFIQSFLVAPEIPRRECYVAIAPFEYANSAELEEVRIVAARGAWNLEVYGEDVDGDVVYEVTTSRSMINEACLLLKSLQFIRSSERPDVSIRVEKGTARFKIEPKDWVNLWIDDPVVYHTGWETKERFRTGKLLEIGTRTKIYTAGTRTRNHAIMIRDLRPLRELIDF